MKITITGEVSDEETVGGQGDMLTSVAHERITLACQSAGLDDVDIEET